MNAMQKIAIQCNQNCFTMKLSQAGSMY